MHITNISSITTHKTAISDGNKSITFFELNERANRIAQSLEASKHSRFFIRANNDIDCLAYMYGATLSSKDLVILPDFVPRFAIEMTKVSLRAFHDARKIGFGDAEPTGGGNVVAFTSGTTGRPQAVALSDHAFVLSNKYLMDALGLDHSDSHFTTAPLLAAPTAYTMPLSIGSTVTCMPNVTSDPYEVVRALHASRANVFSTTPSILEKILDSVGHGELQHLKAVLLATSPTGPRLIAKTLDLNPKVLDLYISTETGPVGYRDVRVDESFTLFPGVVIEDSYGKLSMSSHQSEHARGYYGSSGLEPFSYPLENGDVLIMDGDKIKSVDRHDGKVKVAGFAVNPKTIEAEAMRFASDARTDVVRGEPSDSVVLYVEYDGELSEIRNLLAESLPWYYVPRTIRRMHEYRQ